jgi:exopolyphosphatase/pppGpp-phosphohydrolase
MTGPGPSKTPDAVGDPVPEPVAVLDLGANSFHLLVGGLTEDGSLTVRARSKHMVRLGSAMGRAGNGPAVLGEEAAARGHAAIRSLVQLARLHSPVRALGVATSIFREAANAAVFLRAVHEEHAIPIEVLTGDAEARLTYLGAVGGLPAGLGVTAVVEVGGGSVQIAVGTETDCRLTASLPLGVVRLRQRLRADGVLCGPRTCGPSRPSSGNKRRTWRRPCEPRPRAPSSSRREPHEPSRCWWSRSRPAVCPARMW